MVMASDQLIDQGIPALLQRLEVNQESLLPFSQVRKALVIHLPQKVVFFGEQGGETGVGRSLNLQGLQEVLPRVWRIHYGGLLYVRQFVMGMPPTQAS